MGDEVFRKPLGHARTRFERAPRTGNALREISQALLELDSARSGDWEIMRRRMEPQLSEEARDLLDVASQSSEAFEAFFEGFARAGVA